MTVGKGLLHAVDAAQKDGLPVEVGCHNITVRLESISKPETPPASPSAANMVNFDGDEAQQSQLQKLLNKYHHVFAQHPDDLGHTDFVQQHIPTKDDIPVSQPYRSIPPGSSSLDYKKKSKLTAIRHYSAVNSSAD